MPGAAAAMLWLGSLILNATTPAEPPPTSAHHQPASVQDDTRLLAELLLTAEHTSNLFVEVLSSPRSCRVRVDGRSVLYRDNGEPPPGGYASLLLQNGMYAVSVNPATGRAVGDAFAPGYAPNAGYVALEQFVAGVQSGNVVVFCVLREAALSLDVRAEAFFRALNASYAPDLQARSMFALVAVKDGPVLAEGYSLNLDAVYPGTFGGVLRLAARAPRPPPGAGCLRGRRAAFCARHDGYGGLCQCGVEWPRRRPPPRGALFPYPVVIVASNRPRYLARCLGSLLANRGLDPRLVVVFVDGDYPEVRRLLRLLRVRVHEHRLVGPAMQTSNVGARIGFVYRYTMETAFNMFPDVDKIVLLEEDLEVSPDFISFFNQTYHLLDIDFSLYCISAWNDHGYNHTVGDPAQLYRIGFMPGLGWMLKRSIFFEEFLPAWPKTWQDFDWDVLIRYAQFRKGRDCVIPDVSRTYHFGYIGQHVEATMQYKYYFDHAFNTIPDVQLKDVDKMVFHRYEELLMQGIRNAIKVDETLYGNGPLVCHSVLPDRPTNRSYVMFIRMNGPEDMEVWEKLATCLNLWDLDVRGDHRGIWRFWFNGNPIFVMGVPYAELSMTSIHMQGEVVIFGGKRTASATSLGRWPPGQRREKPSDTRRHFRLAIEAEQKAKREASNPQRA